MLIAIGQIFRKSNSGSTLNRSGTHGGAPETSASGTDCIYPAHLLTRLPIFASSKYTRWDLTQPSGNDCRAPERGTGGTRDNESYDFQFILIADDFKEQIARQGGKQRGDCRHRRSILSFAHSITRPADTQLYTMPLSCKDPSFSKRGTGKSLDK